MRSLSWSMQWKAVIAFCLCVALVPLAVDVESSSAAYAGFDDVDSDAYYADAVGWMVAEGITTGVAECRFGPNQRVTRGQFVVFLWRAAGQPSVRGDHGFTDIRASWMQEAASWASVRGITTGVSPTAFAPDQFITRGDLVTMLWRYAGRPAPASSGAAATKGVTRSYQLDPVDWALGAGISSPGDQFHPDRDTTRAEAATLIWRHAGSPTGRSGGAGGACGGPVPSTDADCWDAPSGWESYEKVNVPVTGGDIYLNAGRDYQVVFPNRPVTGPVRIHDGRNVVVMGGEISIDTFSYSKSKRMGMKVFGSTGIVHLEGLEIGGEWLTEGIQFAAPRAQAVVQHMRVGPIYGGQNAPLNHADLIQTWGGLGDGKPWALRVCGFSGWSNMNGFFLVDDAGGEIGPVDIRYTNIDLVDAPNVNYSEATGGFNAFFMNRVASVHFEPGTVWADANNYRLDGSLSQSLVPRGSGDRVDSSGNVYVEFDRNYLTGRIYHGVVPDYAPAGSVGIGYTPD